MQAPFAYLLMNASRLRSACAFIFKWSVDVYSWTAGECNEYAGTSISLMNLQRISFYLPFMHLSLSFLSSLSFRLSSYLFNFNLLHPHINFPLSFSFGQQQRCTKTEMYERQSAHSSPTSRAPPPSPVLSLVWQPKREAVSFPCGEKEEERKREKNELWDYKDEPTWFSFNKII